MSPVVWPDRFPDCLVLLAPGEGLPPALSLRAGGQAEAACRERGLDQIPGRNRGARIAGVSTP
ncbi:hypothetical protein CNECB9_760025 [Cupriavidus necator]|uniref:Uncharacterized protein n=1 Tax=Cupriavidus necator TaxID=106590 RepID=A0A1K0ISE5_CUPNE|nr:hypothetical protein CNECB9_760025 [Cupriavidus necator]